MVLVEVIVGLVGLSFSVYLWATWKYSYWNRKGVKQLTASFPFGNLKDILLLKENFGVVYDRIYKEAKQEPAIGVYKIFSPQLVICDSDLAKDVLVKEFSSFHDNDLESDSSVDPVLSQNPFVLRGERWKEVRRISTTALTVNRVKKMVDHIKTTCNDMKDHLNDNQETAIEGKAIGGDFTSGVVSGCVYGIACNSFKDPNSPMRLNIKNSFNIDTSLAINFMLITVVPKLAKLLRLRFFPKDVEEFFTKVVDDSIKYRRSNDLQREDFLQHLMQTAAKENMSAKEIMAHSMTFVVDGYETSSLLICHIFDMLSQHPDVQVKLREEINANVKCIDDLSFDLLHSMRYLEAVVNETLRIRPPASVLVKLVTKDITLKKGNRIYELKEGTSIAIPVYSMQKDPKYFDQPDQFRPERFIENPNPEAFLPFGMGPRQCLGFKFALTQVKACLVTVNKYFDIIPRDAVPVPFVMEPKSATLTYKKGGVWVKFRAVK